MTPPTRAGLYIVFAVAVLCVSAPAHAGAPGSKAMPQYQRVSFSTETLKLPPAGTAPDAITIQVTGSFVPADLVRTLAERRIRERLLIDSRAKYRIGVNEAYISPLVRQGRDGFAIVPVRIWGPGLRMVQKGVFVKLENVLVDGFDETDIMYVSNSPESFDKSGEMLNDQLGHGTSSRFMIHHKNVADKSFRFLFFVRNSSEETVTLRVVGDILGLWDEEMIAGHYATQKFLRAQRNGVGYLLDIPPGRYATLQSFDLAPKRIVSGLCEVQVLRGPGVDFSVRVLDSYVGDAFEGIEIGDPTTRRAHGVYESPLVRKHETFTVGGRWAFIKIGGDQLRALSPQSPPLHGNYGVSYEISVIADNPHPTAEKIQFLFNPGGGIAMGTFVINGKWSVVKHTKPPDQPEIASMELAPFEKKRIHISVIPESGSYYPVNLILKSRYIE